MLPLILVTASRLQQSKVDPNTSLNKYSFTGKLDFQPKDNIDITLGATAEIMARTGMTSIYYFSMFNSINNPQTVFNNYSTTFARFRQTFKSNPEDAIQDAYYSVEFSYVNNTTVVQDPTLKDNLFEYGYVGSFNRDFYPPILI